MFHEGFSVLVFLTNGRGSGDGFLELVWEETGEMLRPRIGGRIDLGNDPTEVGCVSFRLTDILFDRPGMYLLRFVFNGNILSEDPLLLR